MNELVLTGCTPEPIGAYLKALGLLRLVGEQADPEVRGCWHGEYFRMQTSLDRNALLRFFLEEYVPTAIIAPWNGGSGFYPGTSSAGLDAIERDQGPRFKAYRAAISVARHAVAALDITHESLKDRKLALIARLRDELDDQAVLWLDAALVMTADGTAYPPLLGTGGNDGRLDFSNNQMQHLATLLIEQPRESESLLEAALFGVPASGLHNAAVGQFSPGLAGGANTSPGFTAKSRLNPWDFVLLLEGAMLLCASVTRRLEWTRPGAMAYPFSVRASSSGYGSASEQDELRTRHELWLPLWDAPVGLNELRALFAEGRVHVGTRPAVTGVDFARAIASLAVDRGISSFARYAFHVRNGLSYFATPLERFAVRDQPSERVESLQSLDPWLDRLRSTMAKAPSALRRAQRRVYSAVLELCRADSAFALQQVIIALGELEATLARSRRFTDEKMIAPLLLPAGWLPLADDNSMEYRLAHALASTRIREHIEPFRFTEPRSWQPAGDPRVCWNEAALVTNLIGVLRRRDLEARQASPARRPGSSPRFATAPAMLSDVDAFIEERVDDVRIEALLRGLACIEWQEVAVRSTPRFEEPHVSHGLFAVLKLVHDREIGGQDLLPPSPVAMARAAAGDALGASTVAVRRLRASGLRPIPTEIVETAERTRRIAAALVFPLSAAARSSLQQAVTVPLPDELEIVS